MTARQAIDLINARLRMHGRNCKFCNLGSDYNARLCRYSVPLVRVRSQLRRRLEKGW